MVQNNGFFSWATAAPKGHRTPRIRMLLLAIPLLILIAYFPAVHGSFLFDDQEQIVENPLIRSLGNFANLSYWTHLQERPLGAFSFALNFSWFGLDSTGYHLTNLFLHMLFTGLCWGFTRSVFRKLPLEASHSEFLAIVAALVVALHPLQTQAVSYIVQRMSVLAALFYVGSCWAYLTARTRMATGTWNLGVIIRLFVAVVCAILGLLAKQNVASIALAWWLMELVLIRDQEQRANRWILILLPAGTLLFALGLLLWPDFITKDSVLISRETYLLTQFTVVFLYLRLLVVPWGQNIDHDVVLAESLGSWPVLLGLLGILALAGLAIWGLRKNKLLALGLIWMAVTLSVESSLIPIRDVAAEHRLYLPMLGFAWIIGTLMLYLNRGRITLALILLVGYGSLTMLRNQVWKSPVALWQDAAQKAPDKARPWLGLGYASLEAGEREQAREALTKAIALNPENPKALNLLGLLAFEEGDGQEAIKLYHASLALLPNQAHVITNIGRAWELLDEPQEALRHYRRAALLEPGNAVAVYNAGNALLAMEKLDQAKALFEEATRIDPEFAEAWSNLGYILLTRKENIEAIQAYENATRLKPELTDSWNNLGNLYLIQGDSNRARASYDQVLQLDPNHPEAVKNRTIFPN